MASRLHAVFLTYTTRRSVWLFASLWLLMHVPLTFGRGHASELPAGAMPIFLFANAGLGLMLGLHVKGQFANPRARLLPDFAFPHLLAAGTIVAGSVLLDACLLAWAHAVSGLAVAAVALALIAGAVWSSCRAGPVSSWLLAILLIAGCAAPQPFAGQILAYLFGGHRIVLVGFTCFGLATLSILAVRLWRLQEAMPEYSRGIPESAWDFMSRGRERDRRRFEGQVIARAKTAAWLHDVRFRLLFRWSGTRGPLGRLLLLQLAGRSPGASVALAQVGLVFYVFWLKRVAPGASDGMDSAFLLSFLPVAVAMGVLGGIWLRRRPYLACESLYPLGRTTFVRGLICNGACDTAFAAAGHCAGLVVGLSLFHVPEPWLAMIGPYLACIVAQYALMHLVTLWLVSFCSFWGLVLGAELASAVSAGLVVAAVFAGEAFWSPARAAMAIALIAAAVILLYRITFRRWCQLELG